MPSLLVFNIVYRLENGDKVSLLVFWTGFVNYCTSNLLSGQLSTLFPHS
jgi:hypothetical protein